tara:strand:- start:162 stop:416 length:255 start_codon:yes stop_codon:yes gene_type:complete
MATVRINIRASTITKTAEVVSNSILLAANAYLITNNIRNVIRDRRSTRLSEGIALTAEIANAVTGLTRVFSETVGRHHAQSEDI